MLNERLDLDAIRDEYQSIGFVRIENVLAPEAAERIHAALTTEVAWELCYLGTNGPISYTTQQLAQMQAAQFQALNQEILTRAQSGFSYFYFRSNLPTTPSPILKEFYAFIRSAAFLDATRHIAQDEAINNATGQVTCYRNANFLRVHTDHNPKEDRRAAYVFGFTRYWEIDWGGLLNIMNADRRIVASHKPGFNTLTLFKVPQPHFVSQVSNFAQGQRLTATGWLIVE